MSSYLLKNIAAVARCASLYRDAQLRDCGLTGYQAPYLPAVCAAPGITQEQLARELHVNRSSVTRQLALLEEAGFVERRRCESDRRAVEVFPTKRAEEALPRVRQTFHRFSETVTDGLTPAERAVLEDVMNRMARRAEEIV